MFADTLLPLDTASLEYAHVVRRVAPILCLALFWCWETWRPAFGQPRGRWRHAARNLTVAIVNTVVLGLVFGAATAAVADWARENHWGLLRLAGLSGWAALAGAMILLDGWMYVWHRANHTLPLLWRFHRMHHTDRHMDVTTATRFHLGEQAAAATIRLALIPLVGWDIWQLVIYDTLLLAGTQFHHADISLGRWDRPLKWLIVTPDMHKVHHSDRPDETNSNYSTILSVWDRLGRSFRFRADPRTLVYGLAEFTDPGWQSLWGMLRTPVVSQVSLPGQGALATEVTESAEKIRGKKGSE